MNVLILGAGVGLGYAISGECVPTGISSYPDGYHCASAPDWGTLRPWDCCWLMAPAWGVIRP